MQFNKLYVIHYCIQVLTLFLSSFFSFISPVVDIYPQCAKLTTTIAVTVDHQRPLIGPRPRFTLLFVLADADAVIVDVLGATSIGGSYHGESGKSLRFYALLNRAHFRFLTSYSLCCCCCPWLLRVAT